MTSSLDIREGDIFTITGLNIPVLNPERHWWTFWRPRYIPGPSLQRFTVLAVSEPDLRVKLWTMEHFSKCADISAGA